jgi:antitoxin component of MazEF toxin-antitoxin module
MKCTRRLVYCNDKFHVILPNNWVKAVDIHKGDHVTLEIDDKDFHRLIIKKSDE